MPHRGDRRRPHLVRGARRPRRAAARRPARRHPHLRASFGDVLPWLARGPPGDRRRAPGPRAHARHRPARCRSTGSPTTSPSSLDRLGGGGPVDLWGFSLGALTATGVAVRTRRRSAASSSRPSTSGPTATTRRSRRRSRTIPACPTRGGVRMPGRPPTRRWRRTPTTSSRSSSACSRSSTTGRAGPPTRSGRSPPRRSSSSATGTSSASTTPPRCSTSSPTAGSRSCPARSTPR